MSKLTLFLPPFAADYSGACSVLFPFDCMVVILDAGCCTRNYAEYDEPRWTSSRKPAFSAQIRTLDTVMGDEQGIVDQVIEAARELSPACIALVGTPVPAVVGMDLPGIAADIRRASGIPCLGIATNGFDTYEHGVSRALRALAEEFALPEAASSCEARARDAAAHRPLRVSLLGMTPLDYPDCSVISDWRDWLGARDIEIVFDGVSSFGPSDVAAFASADASIAVSWGGLAAARLLQQRAGVPFVAGAPLNEALAAELADRLRAAASGASGPGGSMAGGLGGSMVGGPGGSIAGRLGGNASSAPVDGGAPDEDPRVLLVGDQVMMGSVRSALERADGRLGEGAVAIATFFARDAALTRENDVALSEDAQLEAYLKAHPGVLTVGDPLLRRLPSSGEMVEAVHPAISGQLFLDACAAGSGRLDEIRLNAILSRCVSLY